MFNNTSIFARPAHGYRVLICIKGNCAHPELGQALCQQLQQLLRQHGLDDPAHPRYTICQTVQCLGVCASGPIMMVHPEAIRYHQVDEVALGHIVREHLLQGQPVEALKLPALLLSPKPAPAQRIEQPPRQPRGARRKSDRPKT